MMNKMNLIEGVRNRVTMKEYGVLNTCSSDYPGTYGVDDAWSLSEFVKTCSSDYPGTYGVDDAWSLSEFVKKFKIKIIKYNKREMEFDMIGVHAAIVNAFRRILISEVPSMAIEKVFVYNNTSLIQDEVLAHRLGLIPLKADPKLFEYRAEGDEEGSEQDTLEFELKVKCAMDRHLKSKVPNPEDERKMRISKVLSRDIKWVPKGGQKDLYTEDDVGPVDDDILIAKMCPGQEMDLKLLAVKGIGRDHAKFSPVGTAHYRLLPEVTLMRDVEGEQAEKLQKCFSPGVIELQTAPNGKTKAVVADARYDSCSRNVYRHDDIKNAVEMTRVRDHFIFTIESVCGVAPDVLFLDSVKILKQKCRSFLEELSHIS